MEEKPDAFQDAAPYRLEFGVSEESDSTEDNPVLRYERNGFAFIARLDVPKQTVHIERETIRPEVFERDIAAVESEVQRLAEEAVLERWHAAGYFE